MANNIKNTKKNLKIKKYFNSLKKFQKCQKVPKITVNLKKGTKNTQNILIIYNFNRETLKFIFQKNFCLMK